VAPVPWVSIDHGVSASVASPLAPPGPPNGVREHRHPRRRIYLRIHVPISRGWQHQREQRQPVQGSAHVQADESLGVCLVGLRGVRRHHLHR
jgi:hypothetical protein